MSKPLSTLLLALVLPLALPARGGTAADAAPVPLERALPRYTEELRRKRIEGEVGVSFVVDVDGRVKDAAVLRSSHPDLEPPALEAVRKWRFRPARKDGSPVEARVRQTLVFALPQEAASPPPPPARDRR